MSRSSPKILPLVDIPSTSKRGLDEIGFHITRYSLRATTKGLLYVSVSWDAQDGHAHKVKYPSFGGSGSIGGRGSQVEYLILEFPEVSSPFYFPPHSGQFCFQPNHYTEANKATIEVGIYTKTRGARLAYTYLFHDNTKYGACVWFAPDDWAGTTVEKPLFQWKERARS